MSLVDYVVAAVVTLLFSGFWFYMGYRYRVGKK